MYSIDPTPREISLNLAAKFRKLRKKSNMSQAEFADRSGVSLGSLKRFERTGRISLESLLKLAHLIDRSQEFLSLFTWDEQLEEVEKLFTKK